MEINIGSTMYGDSYRTYKLKSPIWRLESMESHIYGTMYGDLYKRYNVWRLI